MYGLDSTKAVRARLIEILYERVALHKDKFIAPILHAEMRSMEVKKNGKVEHSDNSHDDQVFSYLMAMYVWYDGQNLTENFHIIKNTIKTDQNEDLEELEIEDSIESTAKVDIEEYTFDPESDLSVTIKQLEEDQKNYTTTEMFKTNEYLRSVEQRDIILSTNKIARESYARQTGVDPSMYDNQQGYTFVSLPDTLFMDNDLFFDEDGDPNKHHSVLQGNLKDYWDKV